MTLQSSDPAHRSFGTTTENSSLIALQELYDLETERRLSERAAREEREAAAAAEKAAAEEKARAEAAARERVRREREAAERARRERLAADERVRMAELNARIRQEEAMHLSELQHKLDLEIATRQRTHNRRGALALVGTLVGCLGVGALVLNLALADDPKPATVATTATNAEARALAAEAAALRANLERLRAEQAERKDELGALERARAVEEARRAAEEAEEAAEAARRKTGKGTRVRKPRADGDTKRRVKVCNTDDPLAGISGDC